MKYNNTFSVRGRRRAELAGSKFQMPALIWENILKKLKYKEWIIQNYLIDWLIF